jgi:hypothetical protein
LWFRDSKFSKIRNSEELSEKGRREEGRKVGMRTGQERTEITKRTNEPERDVTRGIGSEGRGGSGQEVVQETKTRREL